MHYNGGSKVDLSNRVENKTSNVYSKSTCTLSKTNSHTVNKGSTNDLKQPTRQSYKCSLILPFYHNSNYIHQLSVASRKRLFDDPVALIRGSRESDAAGAYSPSFSKLKQDLRRKVRCAVGGRMR